VNRASKSRRENINFSKQKCLMRSRWNAFQTVKSTILYRRADLRYPCDRIVLPVPTGNCYMSTHWGCLKTFHPNLDSQEPSQDHIKLSSTALCTNLSHDPALWKPIPKVFHSCNCSNRDFPLFIFEKLSPPPSIPVFVVRIIPSQILFISITGKAIL